jgi:hypothetical protein
MFHLAGACGTNTGGLPSLYDGLACVNGNPQLNSVNDILKVVGNVVRILIALAGGVAVIAIIAGGSIWVVSGGDPGRIKLGRDIIANSVAGLVIIIIAYAVVTFIANGF